VCTPPLCSADHRSVASGIWIWKSGTVEIQMISHARMRRRPSENTAGQRSRRRSEGGGSQPWRRYVVTAPPPHDAWVFKRLLQGAAAHTLLKKPLICILTVIEAEESPES